MASKPTNKPNWIPSDDVAKIIEPTTSKKNTGWLALEKPPFQFFNWFFNISSKWIHYFAGDVQYNIIVGGDPDEHDYATMAAYIADSPSVGDRVLIKADEVLTATLVIPAGIEVTILKGNKFTLATNFSPVIQLGNNVKVKGELRVENSDTGTIAKGFSFNGDNSHSDNLIIENKSTGTITDGIYIEAAAEGNYAQSRSINSGAGAITNDLTDNSGNDENHVTAKGDSTISRSRGASHFNLVPTGENRGDSLPLLYGVDSGAADAYVLTLNIGDYNLPLVYVVSQKFKFKATNANVGASTLNINAIGVKSIKRPDGSALQAGDILTNEIIEVLYDGTDFLLWSPKDKIVQTVHTQTGAVATGTTILPFDDTIPTQSGPAEGDEYMSLSITPKNANHKLLIEVVAMGSHSVVLGTIAAALFQDSIANALKAMGVNHSGVGTEQPREVVFTHEMPAGTISPITFKVRMGSLLAGTFTFNGQGGVRRFGGVMASSIRITEFRP